MLLLRRRHFQSAPLLLRRSVGRRWISVVNLWATGMLSIGLPYVQAARDGGVKSTGCPYGVRLYNIQTFPLCVASCCKPIQAIAARLKRCEIKYCYAFVALGRPGSRRGRLLQHQGWVKHMAQSRPHPSAIMVSISRSCRWLSKLVLLN